MFIRGPFFLRVTQHLHDEVDPRLNGIRIHSIGAVLYHELALSKDALRLKPVTYVKCTEDKHDIA